MSDLYLYEDVPVLKNKLGIKNEKTLDRIEAEQSRANMMLLYEQGFQDFSPDGSGVANLYSCPALFR